jgi:hypothetical protein
VDEARARFDEFMNAYVEVSTADLPTAETAEDLFAQVERQAAGLLPQQLRTEIVGRWGERRIMEGSINWSFGAVVEVDLDRKVEGSRYPRVSMDYCVDSSEWRAVDADTGEQVNVSRSQHLWRIAADWSEDWSGLGQGPEGWRIAELDELRDQAC